MSDLNYIDESLSFELFDGARINANQINFVLDTY